MDSLNRLQHYQFLRDLKGPYANEISISDSHYRIVWDSGCDMYEVVIDPADCETEWEEYEGSVHYNWYEDKGFLKDRFWAYFETVEILPE